MDIEDFSRKAGHAFTIFIQLSQNRRAGKKRTSKSQRMDTKRKYIEHALARKIIRRNAKPNRNFGGMSGGSLGRGEVRLYDLQLNQQHTDF